MYSQNVHRKPMARYNTIKKNVCNKNSCVYYDCLEDGKCAICGREQ